MQAQLLSCLWEMYWKEHREGEVSITAREKQQREKARPVGLYAHFIKTLGMNAVPPLEKAASDEKMRREGVFFSFLL